MTDIELTKRYIIEGNMLVKDAIIQVIEEADDHFNNFDTDKDGNLVTNEEISIKIRPIMDALLKDEILDDGNSAQIQKDIFDFCKIQFARYATIPTLDEVKSYLITRNQGFSTN